MIGVIFTSESLENILPVLSRVKLDRLCVVCSNPSDTYLQALDAYDTPKEFFENAALLIATLRDRFFANPYAEIKCDFKQGDDKKLTPSSPPPLSTSLRLFLLDEHSKFIWTEKTLDLVLSAADSALITFPRIFTSNGWVVHEPRVLPLYGWCLTSTFPLFSIETKSPKSQFVHCKSGQFAGCSWHSPLHSMHGDASLSHIYGISSISANRLAFLLALANHNSEALTQLQKIYGYRFWTKEPSGEQRQYSKHKHWKAYHLAGKLMPEDRHSDTRENRIAAYRHAFAIKNRSESASCLSTHCRFAEHRREAWMWAEEGKRLRKELIDLQQRVSFNYMDATEQLDENLGILAFYENQGDTTPGFDAVERMRFSLTIRGEARCWAQNTTPYYLRSVDCERIIQIADQTAWTLLSGFDNVFYVPNNPSVVLISDVMRKKYKIPDVARYVVNVRFVSYVIHDNGGYSTRTPDGIVHTRNLLYFLTQNFEREAVIEIRDIATRPRHPRNVVGLEDPKMFEYDGFWWYSCTTPDTNEINESQDISLVKLDFDYERREGQSIEVYVLSKPDKTRVEKNWCPFVDDGIHWLYLCQPITTCSFDEKVKDTAQWKRSSHKFLQMDSLRGSCCLQPWVHGECKAWIGIHHEVCMHDIRGRNRRCYTHRFAVWNREVNDVLALSRAFYFQEQGIEFANGLCVDGDKVIVSFGMKDQTANVLVYTRQEVLDLLKPASHFRSDVAEFLRDAPESS